MFRSLAVAALSLSLLAGPVLAQETAPPAPAVTAAPNPADVETLDGVLTALYDVISGEAGAPRDWDRFKSLFLPGAVMGGAGPAREGVARLRVYSPEDYIRLNSSHFAENAFYEREGGRHVTAFGALTQVMSVFEIAETAAGPAVQRGVNAIQLFNDGRRWWVVSVTWAGETPDHPIPAEWTTD